MTFDTILAQVIELLQRQGRVSYRALKRRFDLDDEYIEDLKAELIDAQRLARDEEGKVLVWVGMREQQQETHDVQTTPVTPPSAGQRISEAERRQLTVVFCDLVGSTALAGQLDPEDLREVVRAYQQTCTAVIQRFDGHIAQYLGDGLLVYFGYPHAHEDDAQRAIRTGLGTVEAIKTLNTHLEQNKGIQLAIRVGVHTGLVVVGEMGGEARREQLALGETPNIAARIQGLAAPDTVVITPATYRLVQGYFACQDMGLHTLKGVTTPVQVYRVLGESGAQTPLDVAAIRGLTPLIGREAEVTLLVERWGQVKEGRGQVVLLSGEAGIGKSRLVQRQHDPALLVAHRILALSLCVSGELVLAREHLEQIVALYDRQQHHFLAFQYGQDSGATGLTYGRLTLWLLGYPNQALRRNHEALTLAQELSHPSTLAYILIHAALLSQCLQEVQRVQEQAEAAITLSTEQGFPHWLAAGKILQGWALAVQGQEEEGITQMHHSLNAYRATGAKVYLPHYLALMAETYGKVGQIEEGLAVLTEALTLVDKHGERWCEAELYRLKGELLLKQRAKGEKEKRKKEAETCFQHALTIAHRQQAKSLELRAAMSLSRLWQQQGKHDAARELLSGIYGWFTEGFDTADLEAKALLDELRAEKGDYESIS